MPADATIQVLLATFNGERFLREQIDSILQQTYPDVEILARDDGSSDGTPAILSEYAARFPARFRLLSGPATGSAKANFRELMQAATAPYVAFSDQDDVWLPRKLESQMTAMRSLEEKYGASTPLLVFSDLEVVDEGLNPVAPSLWGLQHINPSNVARLPRLLVGNVVTGGTILANRALVERARTIPEGASMHDYWIALVACVFGHATHLPNKLVRYRQHSANVLGAQRPVELTRMPGWRDHTQRRALWKLLVTQAVAFHQTYRDALPPAATTTIAAMEFCDSSSSRLRRVWTMFSRGFLLSPPRATLAIAWYLWDRDASGRES